MVPSMLPDTLVTLLLTGRASSALGKIIPGRSCQPTRTQSRWEQIRWAPFLHKGQMWLLVPLPKVSTMLRHIELQFHQRKLRNTRMTAYPPFLLAEWTHPYLSIYFKGKIMPNYTSQSQVCFSETKYTLISKILPLTHRHFLSEILTPSKLI